MEELLGSTALTTVLLLVFVTTIWRAYRTVVWRPWALSRSFEKQGVRGPPYKFLYGNLGDIKLMKKQAKLSVLDPYCHDITPRVLPHYHKWFSQYGETFLYWNGTEPRLCISDAELAKQILSNKFGFYNKPRTRPELLTLAGKGLVFMEGLDWVRHRRILNPGFSMDRLKDMTKLMADCTTKMSEEWKKQGRDRGTQVMKMDMNKEFQRLTADVIATAAFGSSYAEGIEVFRSQRELQKCCIASVTDVFIPGSQYLPTPSNLQIWKLDRKVKKGLRKIIEARLNSKAKNSESEYGDDLLGLMLTAAKAEEGLKMSMDEIMEECKTFFFAGHETTSNLLTWTIMLLSLDEDWQEKLRDEVFRECGKTTVPNADTLPRFKLMNMVVMEALRLYGSALMMIREATEDMKLGNLKIPKGTSLTIPLVKIHREKELWGEDANAFNPMRFANGVSRAAKHPNALIAFSLGPRACIGQNFALIEAKTVLAMILQRFRFCLADEYKHAPADHLTLQPQFGLPVLLHPLDV